MEHAVAMTALDKSLRGNLSRSLHSWRSRACSSEETLCDLVHRLACEYGIHEHVVRGSPSVARRQTDEGDDVEGDGEQYK
jgi:hypothetical protein